LRILGIDSGTAATGFGIIESDGLRHRLVEAGCICTSPKDPIDKRLLLIGNALRELVRRHQPDEAAIEDIFYAANAKSAFKLAQVRGVALFVLAEAGLRVGEYSPLAVKGSVVGYGRAEKEQVQWMLPSLLQLDAPIESLDACDAVAVAICHATVAFSGVRQ
jgi:crossover junction endodeoxyribonuclease RuvC